MELDNRILDPAEALGCALRALYQAHGYAHYRMSKFEEYDLYSRNKDFLVSDGVITFTDTDGKLLALKPDVTLSIIKNCQAPASGVRKLYYNENVYRVSRGTNAFREIPQVGLECLGAVDAFCVGEVLWLAAESLRTLSPRFVLEVSHLGLLTRFLAAITDDPALTAQLLQCVGEKNLHGITALCRARGIDDAAAAPLLALLRTDGPAAETLPAVETLAAQIGAEAEAAAFRQALAIFEGYDLQDQICIDFSAVSDLRYYNGVVFKGFLPGAPEHVLSGGQYDRLMQRLGHAARAIGFAVYLDRLERLQPADAPYDADVLLRYDAAASPAALRSCIASLIAAGKSVCASQTAAAGLRCRETLYFKDGEVTADGANAECCAAEGAAG